MSLADLRALGAVTQRVAQGVQHRVLERLQHRPVHRHVEPARGDVHLLPIGARHVAHGPGEAAEHGLGRNQRQTLRLFAQAARGRFDGQDDRLVSLREVGGFTGQGRQTGFDLGERLAQRGRLRCLRSDGRRVRHAARGLGAPSERDRVRRKTRDALGDRPLPRKDGPEAVARPRQRLHRRGGDAQNGLCRLIGWLGRRRHGGRWDRSGRGRGGCH